MTPQKGETGGRVLSLIQEQAFGGGPMPFPAPQSRIANDAFLIRVQATGQPSSPGQSSTVQLAVPPGSERVERAFGLLGMMIAGLIIICAVVLLVLKYRRRL
jgi:hypothetical protein